jgi:hypothetical protein
MLGNYQVATKLVASQVMLRSINLVSWLASLSTNISEETMLYTFRVKFQGRGVEMPSRMRYQFPRAAVTRITVFCQTGRGMTTQATVTLVLTTPSFCRLFG